MIRGGTENCWELFRNVSPLAASGATTQPVLRASVFPFQKCVNSVSGFANSIFYRFRFAKFRFLPFQIFKIPFYFFQAVFLL